jgi:hypothetical protein
VAYFLKSLLLKIKQRKKFAREFLINLRLVGLRPEQLLQGTQLHSNIVADETSNSDMFSRYNRG